MENYQMSTGLLRIKFPQKWLDSISLPCDQTPMDFKLVTDYPHSEETSHAHRYNAIVEIVYDKSGRPHHLQVTILGSEKEPEEEVTQWVDDFNSQQEGHPEKEREEARLRALFGIKK